MKALHTPWTITVDADELRRIADLVRTGSTKRAVGALDWLLRRERRRSARFGVWLDHRVAEDRRHQDAETNLAREAHGL